MTVLPVAEARAQFTRIVESAVATHERFKVTRNGKPAVVVIADEDYETMREMIDILSDTDEVAAIREGLADIAAGRLHDAADVEAELRRTGRL